MFIPIMSVITLILSEKNLRVSQERQHFLPQDGDLTGSSTKILIPEFTIKRDEYIKIVSDFAELIADKRPRIGDCAFLPHSKKSLLYAVRWMIAHYEDNVEIANNKEIRELSEAQLPLLHQMFTWLARDWHEIDDEDKEAVARLSQCESFPPWALALKNKYIDEDKASEIACDVAIQVIKDRAMYDTDQNM